MKNLSAFLKVVLTVGFALTMVACDKKKDSQPNFARNNRMDAGNGSVRPGGDPSYGQNGGNGGYIYDGQSDMRNVLYDFLNLNNAQNEIGYVSGLLRQDTGVVITGDISADGQSGRLKIQVWDEIANQYGETYDVNLDVMNGRVDNQGATITLRDNAGTVVLDGNWTDRDTWEGEVHYTNDGQSQRRLGYFITSSCSPIRCQ